MIYTDVLFLVLLLGLWAVTLALRPWPPIREWVIIAFSLLFVASWGIFSLSLLLCVALTNFAAVKLAVSLAPLPRRVILTSTIVFDLLTLGFFKYSQFANSIFDAALHVKIGIPQFAALGIPLAISFYTFHLISYVVDITKRHTQPLPFRKFIFYICFFPHVVAGPIVRTWQLVPQLGKVRRLPADIVFGLHFLVVGFFLKAVVANNLAQAIDPIWSGKADWTLSVADHWITAFLYYCQIYSDFAGYSLMALGLARLLGYRLPPNFRAPLLAGTIQDFWRRWHITLSRWLRDYLYIPLGGNRHGTVRALCNVFVTFLLGGLWHGAGWTFVIWGAMHGLGIGCERLFRSRAKRAAIWNRAAWWAITQAWVTIAWVFFRSSDLGFATDYIRGMFQLQKIGSLSVHGTLAIPLLVAAAAVAHQLTPFWITRVPRKRLGQCLGVLTGLILVLDLTVYSPSKGFIYFKF